jgi:hypothetical protein
MTHEERHDRHDRRMRVSMILLWVFTVGVLSWQGWMINENAQRIARNAESVAQHTDRDARTHIMVERQVTAFEQAQINASCHRLNIERTATNRNILASYEVDRMLQMGVKTVTGSSTIIARIYAASADARAWIGRREWVPLTDCRRAARMGEHYPTPAAVPITVRLPPASALHLGPDN